MVAAPLVPSKAWLSFQKLLLKLGCRCHVGKPTLAPQAGHSSQT